MCLSSKRGAPYNVFEALNEIRYFIIWTWRYVILFFSSVISSDAPVRTEDDVTDCTLKSGGRCGCIKSCLTWLDLLWERPAEVKLLVKITVVRNTVTSQTWFCADIHVSLWYSEFWPRWQSSPFSEHHRAKVSACLSFPKYHSRRRMRTLWGMC